MTTNYKEDITIYEYPDCIPVCLVNNDGCPNDINCHQIHGAIYRIDNECYKAVNGCSDCLADPDRYPQSLQPIICPDVLPTTTSFNVTSHNEPSFVFGMFIFVRFKVIR